MSEFLIKRFVRDWKETDRPAVRLSYSVFAGICGIIVNILLVIIKLITGIVFRSVSVISDAFNNLFDCLTGILLLIGFRASSRPADAEHPFGHGRLEYILALAASALIFMTALTLGKESITRILHPDDVRITVGGALALLATVLLKIALSHLNMTIGKRIGSPAVSAVGRDALGDAAATGVSLAAVLITARTGFRQLDGIAGLLIAVLILRSGWETASDVISRLLGTPADADLCTAITNDLLAEEKILGVHDVIIHDYGPGRLFGSAHIELDSRMSFRKAHDTADAAEKKIQEKYHVQMILHMDPADYDDPDLQAARIRVAAILKTADPSLTMHDFRMDGDTMIFDVAVPAACHLTNQQINEQLEQQLDGVHLQITYDRQYIAESTENL